MTRDERDIRRMVSDELAEAITNTAFEVFVDTDGHKSIRVHPEHEGLTLAAQVVRETGGLMGTRPSADVLLHLESWLRVQYHQSRKEARATSKPAAIAESMAYSEVLDKLSDLRGGL